VSRKGGKKVALKKKKKDPCSDRYTIFHALFEALKKKEGKEH